MILLLMTALQFQIRHNSGCSGVLPPKNKIYKALKIQDYEQNTITTIQISNTTTLPHCVQYFHSIIPTRQGSDNQFMISDRIVGDPNPQDLIINLHDVSENNFTKNKIDAVKFDRYEGYQFDSYVNERALYFNYQFINQSLSVKLHNLAPISTQDVKINVTDIAPSIENNTKRSYDFGNFLYDDISNNLFFGMYGPRNDPLLNQLVQINLDNQSLVETYPVYVNQLIERNTQETSLLVKSGSSNTTIIALNPENKTLTTLQQFNQKIDTNMIYNFEELYLVYLRNGTVLEVNKDTLDTERSYEPDLATMTENYKIKPLFVIIEPDLINLNTYTIGLFILIPVSFIVFIIKIRT